MSARGTTRHTTSRAQRWRRACTAVGVAACLAAGCSSGGSPADSADATTTTAAPTPRADLDLRAVRLAPLPEGDGGPLPSASLSPDYTEQEHLLSGEAMTYSGPASEPATPTGDSVAYVTRVLVRFPSDRRDFSGRVWVEPYNTSGGGELDAVWALLAPMLQDNGDAWVGVTERFGSVSALQSTDPVRYAAIDIPTNDVAWDILRQVGGLLKEGGDQSPLGEMTARHLYLSGYSQSGVEVASFASAFNEDTRMQDGSAVYDGYLPAAHAASLTALESGTAALPPFEFEPMGPVDVPVIDIETQSDVEGFIAPIDEETTYTNPGASSTRRDDSDAPGDLFRRYEVAGAPHAPTIPGCAGPASSFPVQYFIRAAAERLVAWSEDDVTPGEVPGLELASDDGVVSTTAVDEVGNPVGGVRSPFLDVPLSRFEVHSTPEDPSTPGALCELAGRETPLSADVLADRYDDAADYLDQFTESLDATIDAGLLRRADRQAILEDATAAAEERLPQ